MNKRRIPSKPKGKYKSTFEWTFARNLSRLKVHFEYERAKIEYTEPNKSYVPDFWLKKKSGGFMIIETKGYFDRESRKKLRDVRACHPDLDIRLVFMSEGWVSRKKHTKYSDWAKKHGFKWHFGPSIPLEWIEELSA